MTEQEKAANFFKELKELEARYGLVLSAYSGTGDFYVSFFDAAGRITAEIEQPDNVD